MPCPEHTPKLPPRIPKEDPSETAGDGLDLTQYAEVLKDLPVEQREITTLPPNNTQEEK